MIKHEVKATIISRPKPILEELKMIEGNELVKAFISVLLEEKVKEIENWDSASKRYLDNWR